MNRTRSLRITAAALILGAGVHVTAYVAGPRAIALLGAPPGIVASAIRGTWPAPVATGAIVASLVLLAFCCRAEAAGSSRLPLRRPVLALAAMLFVARGLLLPLALGGRRVWPTPVGTIVVRGAIPIFVAGSIFVLAIGLLIARGLLARDGGPRA